MFMKNKKLPPAYKIVRSHWSGSFTMLAEYMNRSKSNICQTLRKNRLHYNNQVSYTNAINWCFNKNYEIEDLFPTIK